MFELILLVVLLAVGARVVALDSAAEVPHDVFMQCLAMTEEPAVVVVHRSLFWLVGAARNRYIIVFRGLRVHAGSFRPLNLPPDVPVFETRKL